MEERLWTLDKRSTGSLQPFSREAHENGNFAGCRICCRLGPVRAFSKGGPAGVVDFYCCFVYGFYLRVLDLGFMLLAARKPRRAESGARSQKRVQVRKCNLVFSSSVALCFFCFVRNCARTRAGVAPSWVGLSPAYVSGYESHCSGKVLWGCISSSSSSEVY